MDLVAPTPLLDPVALVDLVIVIVAIELVALFAFARRNRAAPRFAEFVPNIVAGLCLMLALRGVLSGAQPIWLLLALSAAGIAHLFDLRRRIRGS